MQLDWVKENDVVEGCACIHWIVLWAATIRAQLFQNEPVTLTVSTFTRACHASEALQSEKPSAFEVSSFKDGSPSLIMGLFS